MAEPASSRRSANERGQRSEGDSRSDPLSPLSLPRPALSRIALSAGLVLLSLSLILTIGVSRPQPAPRGDGAPSGGRSGDPGPRPYAKAPPVGVAAPPDRPNASDQDALRSWAHRVSERTSIPAAALVAYGRAEMWMRYKRPDCDISWSTLAAIGKLASAHGTDVTARQRAGDTPVKGPLRIPAGIWQRWAARASGDGSPAEARDLGDSALTVARFLCAATGNMREPNGWWNAVSAYRHSTDYAERVYSAARRYALASRS